MPNLQDLNAPLRGLRREVLRFADGSYGLYLYCLRNRQRLYHGLCRVFWANGRIKSEHTFRHGVSHGPSRWYFESGQPGLDGSYFRGERHGLWREWYVNNAPQALLHYCRGALYGRCVWWWLPGARPDIRKFRNGVEVTGGKTRQLQTSLEQDRAGRLIAQTTYYTFAQTRILHGTVMRFRPGGGSVELPYKDGVIHGRGCEWDRRGRLREFAVISGKRTYCEYAGMEWGHYPLHVKRPTPKVLAALRRRRAK